jgi:hypothetical protein
LKQHKTIVALIAIVLLAAGAWAFGFFSGTDPAVAELQQMANHAFEQDLPEAQEAEFRQQFRQKMDSLTPEQREAFFAANRVRGMQYMERRMNAFFAMSPQEQQKRLDEIIDQMTRPREGRSQNGGDRAGRADGGSERAGRDDGGRGGWRNMTEAQRDERSKRRLDQTSPKMRAQFTEFRKKLEARAKERGISQLPGWGRGGRRG